jgi:hypothetical protein
MTAIPVGINHHQFFNPLLRLRRSFVEKGRAVPMSEKITANFGITKVNKTTSDAPPTKTRKRGYIMAETVKSLNS